MIQNRGAMFITAEHISAFGSALEGVNIRDVFGGIRMSFGWITHRGRTQDETEYE
jgi:hypothetical protein